LRETFFLYFSPLFVLPQSSLRLGGSLRYFFAIKNPATFAQHFVTIQR